MTPTPPPLIGLFSGAGGLDLGFERAGFDVRVAVDNQEPMCETYRRNFPSTAVLGPPHHSGDAFTISGEELMAAGNLKRGEVAAVVGGPPCQPFSVAATQRYIKSSEKFGRKGFEDETRGGLPEQFVRLVKQTKPEFFVMENVPGLVDVDCGLTLQTLIVQLRKAGYAVSDPYLALASDYGVPQNRTRLIVIGVKGKKPVSFPAPLYGEGLFRPFRTVAHALAHTSPDLPNHVTRKHAPESVARYRKLAFGKREPLGRVDRLDPRKPAKTVIAGGSKGGGRSHLHPYIARTLSVRESARLQTFPDDFIFTGTMGRQFTQVGNAVPPLLAERLGRHLMREVFGVAQSEEPTLAEYLHRSESLEELCEIVLEQAMSEGKPDWLYEDVAT